MEAQHKGSVRDDRGAENSWVQDAAKSCVPLPLPLFSLEDMGGRREHSSLSLCGNPLSAESDVPTQCFEATFVIFYLVARKSHVLTHCQRPSKESLCAYDWAACRLLSH